jgi:hypothetical protein
MQACRVANVSVPDANATLDEVMHFATMAYFGYDRYGGVDGFAKSLYRSMAS